MATITKDNTFSAGATIVASEHNANFDTVYNDYNGNITNANLSASAAIADTKLAQLTTASKVNLTALVISSQTAGDIIFASSATVLARLAAGSAGQLLQSAGTAAPVWASTGLTLQIVNSSTTANIATNVVIPYDDTKPGSAEGAQIFTQAITPAGTDSRLKIECNANMSFNADDEVILALYDSGNPATADAIAATVSSVDSNQHLQMDLVHFLTTAATSATTAIAAITFSIRMGGISAGTVRLNSDATSADLFDGVASSSLTITELSA